MAITHESVRRLKYYQLQTMLRTLSAPRSLLHEPVQKMREWIVNYADSGCDLEVTQALAAVTEGKRVPDSDSVMQGPSLDDVKALVSEYVNDASALLHKRFAEEVAKAIEATRVKKYEPIEVKGVVKPKKLKVKPHVAFERALQLASQRVNVMLVGPAGCGKTFLGKQVAEALDLPFSSISCSVGMSEAQLAGWLLPVGQGGRFDYVPAPFVEAYEKGGVFLLDEVDAGDANTMTFLNKALANDGFFVPQRRAKPFIKRHPNFVALAAANTFGGGADAVYVGRNQLDAATLDRFGAGTIYMDYDRDLERELIHPEVLKWGWAIREKIGKQRLRRIMSTRVMLDLTKMAEAYKWKQPDWERSYFAAWSDDERRRVATQGG